MTAPPRQHQTHVCAKALHQSRHAGCLQEGDGLRKVVAVRVFPGAIDQVAQHHLGHIHQHQADQNFIGVERLPQPGHHPSPHGPAQSSGRQHTHQQGRPRLGRGLHGNPTCKDGPHDELPLGPDIPEVGAKAHSQPQRYQHQRRGLHAEFGPGIGGANGLPEKHAQALYRVFAQQRK